MSRFNKIPALLLSAVLLGVPATGCAVHPPDRTAVTYKIHEAPPAPQREVVVARPGRGYVWVAGHYLWKPAGGYVWVSGKWTRPPRRGAVWVAPRYQARRGGWIYFAGYWR